VTLLLRYSKDIVCDVNATSANGSTPLMLCFEVQVQQGLRQETGVYNTFSQDDADNFVQLLLDNGASVAPAVLKQQCRRTDHDSDSDDDDDEQPTTAIRALSDYMTRLRSSVAAHTAALAVHAEACSTISIQQQHTGTNVHSDSMVSNGGSDSSNSSSNSAVVAAAAYAGASSSSAATGGVQHSSSITVQLVHAVSGVKAAKLYKLELRTLERLLAVHSGQTSSVLLNLLRPHQVGVHKSSSSNVILLSSSVMASTHEAPLMHIL
jgi:hypothetical protein